MVSGKNESSNNSFKSYRRRASVRGADSEVWCIFRISLNPVAEQFFLQGRHWFFPFLRVCGETKLLLSSSLLCRLMK